MYLNALMEFLLITLWDILLYEMGADGGCLNIPVAQNVNRCRKS